MKEPITKFDLEAAFKALDDLGAPRARKGLKANRPALTEIFSRKTGFDALMEEYYDVNDTAELNDAQEAREAEIAKAKLARIEKIVDLDAESPDDLLASYVGKYIMQCPQCMTLFYKNQEDIEKSEEDPSTVNINEVCQHCGNDSGYTLIGKVGEAEAEEAQANEDADLDLDVEEEPVEEEAPAETDEASDDEGAEDFDLAALDDIDLDEEPTTTEESHQFNREGTLLVEDLDDTLTEAAAADISEAEFKELISTPEFKTPISDSSVRAMLNSMKEDEEDDTKNESVKESVTVNNMELKYAVLNADGTYAGEPCATEEAAKELASHQEGRIIVKLDEAEEALNEAGLGLLAKTIKKKVKQTSKDMKAKASDAILKFADKAKTRDEKADWILANALKDYSSISVDEEGRLVPDVQNQKFTMFIVLGFAGKYRSGKPINMAPSYNNDSLVLGMKVQEREEYALADSLAKGWSMKDGNGPAFIFMAKDKNDTEAAFLCQYFRGELKNDQLEKSFETVKKQLLSSKLVGDGGFDETDVELDGDEEATATTESLNNLMTSIEDLHESSLEHYITWSLKEAYANVKDFKLSACTYFNEKLTVDGIISFKSGNTRKTSYVFTEAMINNNVTKLVGFNEKLGLDKKFIATGHTSSNRFITEAFISTK